MPEVAVSCPHCLHPTGSLSSEKGVGYCFRCGKAILSRDLRNNPAHGLFPEVTPLPDVHLEPVWGHPEAVAYLRSRRVDPQDIPGVMYDPDKRRLYFRVWSPYSSIPSSWHTRGISAWDGWRIFSGTKKQNYVAGQHPQPGQRLVLVEGIFDCLRIGPGAISLLGSTLYEPIAIWLRTFPELLVWGDPDPAGDALVRQSVDLLGSRVTPVYSDREPGDVIEGHPILAKVREWLEGDSAYA